MKSLKVLAPLALVGFTLASCNNGLVSYSTIKRVEYKESTPEEVEKVIGKKSTSATATGMWKKQYSEPVDMYHYGTFNLPSKQGTIKATYALGGKGKIKLLYPDVSPIDLTNLNGALGDSLTYSWDQNNKYIKISDSKSYSYVVYRDNHYWKCYEQDGTKVRLDITDIIQNKYTKPNPEEGKPDIEVVDDYFNNYVMVSSAQNLGFFSNQWLRPIFGDRKVVSALLEGAGFGLSGFGGDYDIRKGGEIYDTSASYNIDVIHNYLCPSLVFGGQLNQRVSKTREIHVNNVIAAVLKYIAGGYTRFGTDDADTASVNLGIKDFDLSGLPDLIKAIKPEIMQKISKMDMSGLFNIDYFLAYNHSFIKQQEFILQLNNAKATVIGGTSSKMFYGDLDLNATIYLGQDVTETCTVDDVVVTDYEDITPKDPTPSADIVLE